MVSITHWRLQRIGMITTIVPLVSVIVPSYNSAETICETLNSIKAQTYQHFEVIICDDASTDKTVQSCRAWLDENHGIAKITRLLVGEENVGTCKNLNNAIRLAHGDWIKIIAADDRLLPNCLEDDVNFITLHPDTEILFTSYRGFGDMRNIEKRKCIGDRSKFFQTLSPRHFKMVLFTKNFLSAPSALIKTALNKEFGGFDESFRLIEDWPFWMKAVDQGKVMRYLPKETVEYRLSDKSVSNNFHNPMLVADKKRAGRMSLDYMRKISFLSKVYVGTLLRIQKKPTICNRALHSLNVFNPFYWELRSLRKLLDD